jgi:hypothetical protein
MRRKLVLWGSNEKEEKLLVALELLEKENVVNIYTFPENIATETLYKDLSEKWKDDTEVEFPAGFAKIERKLSVSDSILPDEIRVERPELITRAQAEWHFVVLSSKLYGLYKSELEELKDKIEKLGDYDNGVWEELRTFWNKVQGQVNDKNLFREHGAALREKTNYLFDKLKELKKVLEGEFESNSKQFVQQFQAELNEIEEKINKGLGLAPLFEDLKKIQARIRDVKFTKDDRNEVWAKIDETFKKLKEKRGAAGSAAQASNFARLDARYTGLIAAIQKMQKSIDFDQKELDFQNKRVADSDGQLESQLRQAKIRMIEERVKSKQEKLDDMNLTKKELESKMEKEKKKAAKVEKQEKIEEAKETVKQKIADSISETAKELDKMSDKLEKAATEIKTRGKKAATALQDMGEEAEFRIQDAVDTVKAVAEVAEEKWEDTSNNVKESVESMLEKAASFASSVAEKIEDSLDTLSDKIEEQIEHSKERQSQSEETPSADEKTEEKA